MTTEIPRDQWKEFFDNLSKELIDWETNVQILSDGDGAQMLSEGLPFGGLTFEDSPGAPIVELWVGSGPENHQSHIITDPKFVAFENTGLGPNGVLDIEDGEGRKTLVTFLRPFPILVEYVKAEMINL